MHQGHATRTDDDIELGDEPPLLADGPAGQFDRRRVSLRWLTGTVLTGMTSTFLMGGALFVALDGRQMLAATPAELTRLSTAADPGTPAPIAGIDSRNSLPKGDRLRTGPEPVGARQVLNLSTMTHVGDKDIVRIKPFVRIATALTMKASADTAKMPDFDPLKVFANTDLLSGRTSNVRNPAFYDAAVDGEMALKTRDLPMDPSQFDVEAIMSSLEVERIVRDQARFLTDGSVQVAALPTGDVNRIEATFGTPGLDSAMALRITSENVSFFAKSDVEKAGAQTGNGLNEKIITVGQNDTLKSILKDNQADDKESTDIIKALGKLIDLKTFDAGMRVRIGLAKIDVSEKLKPVRVSLYNAAGHLATVALSDEGNDFVGAQEPDLTDAAAAQTDEDESVPDPNAAPSLYHSLYQTALDNQVPSQMIRELVQIYSYDVDFNQRIKQGDAFELFYSQVDEAEPNSRPEILYTALNIRGQLKRFYRYRSPDDGTVDYYDESGKSAKKFLMRKPMDGGVLRSGFGGRVHPILGYYRMHTGVDWANPIGSPILASGNGTVVFAGWKGGYGRYIRLQHANGYETGYGHQSGFAKGIAVGTKVHQGQVIGYVGSTGQSTGPHLHYEVLINGAFVDPMRVRLPRGKELGGPMLAEFQKERERIDTLMSKSGVPGKIAQGG
ncbi:MAG: M23 family metallopeptidase [Ancalomicrobiaceae bacterium]|nr:M23 family metallopeptidase [Ancalomicrobiaceae bacterium]